MKSATLGMLLLALGLLVGCDADIESEEAGQCDDGVDNDQDGNSDCADDGCAAATACAGDDDDTVGDDDSSGDDDDAPGAIPVGSNVLLLIADDLGLDGASFDSTSPCYAVGNVSDDAPMPNLAALCASGVRFENAWAMPTCSPTRATMGASSMSRASFIAPG